MESGINKNHKNQPNAGMTKRVGVFEYGLERSANRNSLFRNPGSQILCPVSFFFSHRNCFIPSWQGRLSSHENAVFWQPSNKDFIPGTKALPSCYRCIGLADENRLAVAFFWIYVKLRNGALIKNFLQNA